jgi:hypothetical protein
VRDLSSTGNYKRIFSDAIVAAPLFGYSGVILLRIVAIRRTIMSKRVLVSMVAVMGLATLSLQAGDVLKNPDFSKDLNYWMFRATSGYVPKPRVELRGGVLSGSKCSPLTAHYLSLHQVVNIREGKRYKLTYEAKGKGGGHYRVLCGQAKGESTKRFHLDSKKQKLTEDWTSVEEEFVGKFDTDATWYRKVLSSCKSNKLKNGQAYNRETMRLVGKDEDEDEPSHSTLRFQLGALEGEFALRNISLVELD